MKKRGAFSLSMEFVIGLILVIIFLIGGFSFISKIFSSRIDEQVINTACYESVLFNSERRVPGVEAETMKTKCATKYITFHKERAESEFESNPMQTSENKPVKLPDLIYKGAGNKECSKTDDEEACMFRNINRIIANEMARCWNNFHKGNKRVFSTYTEGSQCIVCTVFIFDSEMIGDYRDRGLIGMNDPENENYSLDLYMRQNSEVYYTGEENYYKYTLDLIDSTFELPYYDYDVNREYAVVFMALNKPFVENILSHSWDKLKEKILGYDEESEEGNFVNRIEFIPNEKVSTTCEQWA